MEKIWGEFLPYSLLIQSTVGLIEVSQNFITFPDKLHVLTGVGAGGGIVGSENCIIPYLDLQQPTDRFSARWSFSKEPTDLMPPIPDVPLPTLETFRF